MNFDIFIICVVAAALYVPPHGFQVAETLTVHSSTDLEIPVEKNVNHFLWLETRSLCNIHLSLFEKVSFFTEVSSNVFSAQIQYLPVNHTITTTTTEGETHHGLWFEHHNCLENDCSLVLRIEASETCEVAMTIESGQLVLPSQQTTVMQSEWAGSSSNSKLYAVKTRDLFELFITTPHADVIFQVFVYHGCTFREETILAEHTASAHISILPQDSSFVCFWVLNDNSDTYSISFNQALVVEEEEDRSMMSNVVLLLGCLSTCLFCVVIVWFLQRLWASREKPPTPASVQTVDDKTSVFKWDRKVKKKYKKRKAEARCSICLEYYSSSEELRKLPCCHEFHRTCIDIWLTHCSDKCPMCMQTLEQAQDFHRMTVSPSRSPRALSPSLSPTDTPSCASKSPFTRTLGIVRRFSTNYQKGIIATSDDITDEEVLNIHIDAPSKSVDMEGAETTQPLVHDSEDESPDHTSLERTFYNLFYPDRSVDRSRTRSVERGTLSRSPFRRWSVEKNSLLPSFLRNKTSSCSDVKSIEFIE